MVGSAARYGEVHDTHGAAAQLTHNLVASNTVHQTYSVLCPGRWGYASGALVEVLGSY
jgi:hypothetical protein